MKKYLIIIFLFFSISHLQARDNLVFYIEKALENNLQLNAERKNFESAKQDKNISRSEFLPSITLSGDQTSTTSTNRTNQSGSSLADSNSDTESKKITVEQKIFSGFKGLNTFKKTELETQKANLSLKKIEQQTILDTASTYFDLIFKFKNEKFNLSNVNLFQRQVDSDSARLQKGEITLTDLAQSESSLAGAKANLIKAKTELLTSKKNFERVTREKTPDLNNLSDKVSLILPNSFEESLEIANTNNVDLLISNLDYEISVKELNIERARLSPSASLNYSKSENNDFSSTIDETDQETVKATITWPIIKGGENISSIKKSSYNKQRYQLILQDTKNKINTEISNAWSKYQSFKSVLEATKAQLKAAEIANEGITLEYDSGNTRTTLELIQSRSLLLDARITFARSERDFVVSQFELAKQLGSLSIKSIK
ncbi:TolC family protein [Pelagibacterales bacterium SAG-MED41]|jgi:outer membrane protein|nr:TolC family protein [Pelagibacterales bacterium SAG-MED41]